MSAERTYVCLTPKEPGSEHPFRRKEEAGAHSPRAPRSAEETSRTRRQQVRHLRWRRNPLKALFGQTRREQYVERYILREHARRRPLAEILEDPYVRAWSTPEERARLFQRPNVVAAMGEQTIADLRATAARGRAA